jgi:hypothetical protein
VLGIPLLLAPLAFAAGVYIAERFAPPLAATRTGLVARWTVDALTGAACAVIVLTLFLAVRVATENPYPGFARGDSIGSELATALWQGGLLVGLAAVVHLLAPAPEDDRE